MITLKFKNGQEIKTQCHTPASAIRKAGQVSPIKGTIEGTELYENGRLIGIITSGLSWAPTVGGL